MELLKYRSYANDQKQDMIPNLNNRKFKSISNSENGEVSAQTVFSYSQSDSIIWAEYSGGQIVRGNLLGKVEDDHLAFVYHHINMSGEMMTGTCTSYPDITENNKLKFKEYWQWTCKDRSSGESTIIEILE